ncbi:helix-turn-helix transcriptional regulator, partial [bacterium]|nr:helix-turn-helix transcriptional regulator [bacterium]
MCNYLTFEETCILIGKNIKNYRLKKGFSLKDLSQKTNISQTYLKKIENGTATRMKIVKHLLSIAKALEVNLSTLF